MASLCVLLGLITLINPIFGVIYKLSDADYKRMPPIYHLDDYENCLKDENAVYCTIIYDAVSDGPSELLTMMEEYSKQNKTHHNHTSYLTYGMCVSQNCKNYASNKESDPKQNLERCLNKTIWNWYKLKTRITDFSCNTFKGNKIPIDVTDIIVALIVFSLLVLSIVGSLHDVLTSTYKGNGNKYLLSFSVQRNWKKLIAPYKGTDYRSDSLHGLNGIKSIGLICVILVHSLWSYAAMAGNTQDLEKMYDDTWPHIAINGTVFMQIYFLVSAFLLMYKMLQYAGKSKMDLSWISKGLLMRWLRLTPCYAVTLGIVATWFRRAGTGPMWEILSMKPANDCRRHWLSHVLYLNNFVYHSECMIHTWYLAADMQVYILALLVIVLTGDRTRKVTLVLLYIVGLIIPAAITYFLDLEALNIFSPKLVREFFRDDPTHHEVYTQGYANIAPMALGLILGELVYKWQTDKAKLEKVRKSKIYRYFYWGFLPITAALLLSLKCLYRDTPRDPLLQRVLIAFAAKPILGLMCGILVTGVVFKIEESYRGIFEWAIWTPISRLSYCAYLVHLPIMRYMTGIQTVLSHVSPLNLMATFVCITILSILISIPLWVVVEAPLGRITSLCLTANIPNEEPKSKLKNK